MTKTEPVGPAKAPTSPEYDKGGVGPFENEAINPYGSGPLPIEPRHIDHDEKADETRREDYLAQASRQ